MRASASSESFFKVSIEVMRVNCWYATFFISSVKALLPSVSVSKERNSGREGGRENEKEGERERAEG